MDKHNTELVVKVNNAMNTVALGKLNAVELDLLYCICATVKEKGTDEIVLSFDKIRQITNYSSTDLKDFVRDLDRTNKKLINLDFKIETETLLIRFVLFPTFAIDTLKKQLTVAVNQKFAFVLNDLTSDFTRFELQEFLDVKSKYSKVLYKLLKQYRHTGILVIDIAEFRRLLDVPKSYQMSHIDDKILNPAIKELKPVFRAVGYKKIKDPKQKNKVVQLQFYFTKESRGDSPSLAKAKKAPTKNDDFLQNKMGKVPKFEK